MLQRWNSCASNCCQTETGARQAIYEFHYPLDQGGPPDKDFAVLKKLKDLQIAVLLFLSSALTFSVFRQLELDFNGAAYLQMTREGVLAHPHHFLYFWILRGAVLLGRAVWPGHPIVFGEAVSVVFGAGGLALFFLLCRWHGVSRTVALLSALLLLMSRPLMWASTNIEAKSALFFGAALVLAAAVGVRAMPRAGRWIALGAAIVFALGIHAAAAGLVLVVCVAGAAEALGRDRSPRRAGLWIVCGGVGLAYLLLIMVLGHWKADDLSLDGTLKRQMEWANVYLGDSVMAGWSGFFTALKRNAVDGLAYGFFAIWLWPFGLAALERTERFLAAITIGTVFCYFGFFGWWPRDEGTFYFPATILLSLCSAVAVERLGIGNDAPEPGGTRRLWLILVAAASYYIIVLLAWREGLAGWLLWPWYITACVLAWRFPRQTAHLHLAKKAWWALLAGFVVVQATLVLPKQRQFIRTAEWESRVRAADQLAPAGGVLASKVHPFFVEGLSRHLYGWDATNSLFQLSDDEGTSFVRDLAQLIREKDGGRRVLVDTAVLEWFEEILNKPGNQPKSVGDRVNLERVESNGIPFGVLTVGAAAP
ncbi:MAG: hypothetical protein K1X53_05830 [Candidatus Sumerlaeaceae bacterium]|nr:hypothetical protein [Candidatus Sumerlaeaceae bacterium]